jgi:hypothetical protein
MGLILTIVRGPHSKCGANRFNNVDRCTITRIVQADRTTEGSPEPPRFDGGPFEPTDDAPECELVWRYVGSHPCHYIRPVTAPGKHPWFMFGGCFCHTSDSRFSSISGIYGATPLHDRVE